VELTAILIFAVTLAAIVSERVDRTKAALAGAGAMVLIPNLLDEEQALSAVDLKTLGLLAGMMVVVASAEESGAFEYLALRAAQLSRARPLPLLAALAVITSGLSAFLDNLTAVLLVVPIAFTLGDRLGIPVTPLVVTEVIASNVGGTATLIGDPPNIMIGAYTGLTFTEFIVALAPVSALTLTVTIGLLYAIFRAQLRIPAERRAAVLALDPRAPLREGRHLRRSMAVLAGTVLLFFLHSPLGIGVTTVAITGAVAAMITTRAETATVLRRVDWSTLFFFAGLFVMVHGLALHGTLDRVADTITDVADGDETATLAIILWGSAAGSAVVDNIPFTAALLPVVEQVQPSDRDVYWWSLALGACLGGNATLVAAAANVAAVGAAGQRGRHIGFWEFTRVGLPVTVVSLSIATAYVLAVLR
jgi:Na+/H+ antiporter NhaD/arsenite permease-like protein